jgi:hypothetical protein
METPSYAWRGFKGVGKRTQLLAFLKKQAEHMGQPFELRMNTWYLNKPVNNADPDEDDDEIAGKSIPYEESALHMAFDVARMSMSDKLFLQSILTRWTGQQDVCLVSSTIHMRYLVLYHAHYLTDESVLQLQESLEQFPHFAILLTTELPLRGRLRDACFEIPVGGEDRLLLDYTTKALLSAEDVWLTFFQKTLEDWSVTEGGKRITDVRTWIYTCLQRNLRWTDVIMYWVQVIGMTPWISVERKRDMMETLWRAESGSGWVLVTSYRIPILWEHVHLRLARQCFESKEEHLASSSRNEPSSS